MGRSFIVTTGTWGSSHQGQGDLSLWDREAIGFIATLSPGLRGTATERPDIKGSPLWELDQLK